MQTTEFVQNASLSLSSLEANLDQVSEDVESLKTYIVQINEIVTNQAGAINAINQELEAFDGVLEDLESLKNGYVENTEILTNLSGSIDTILTDLSTLQTDVDALKTAVQTLQNAGYITATDASAKYATIESVNAVKTSIGTAIEDALKNDGKISAAIASAVSSATSALQGQIDALKKDVTALAKRIQSIVYVPEFANGAKAVTYTVGTTKVSEYTTATFKVTPVECADVFSATSSIDENGSLVPAIKVYVTGTLSAAECNEVPANKIVINNVDVKTGLVTVTVLENLKDKAMALAYESNTKGWAEDKTGTYVTSDFAPVQAGPAFEILSNIKLYNGTREYATVNAEKAWDKYGTAEALVAPFAGYAPYVKEGTKYYTVDEFKAAHFIDANISFTFEAVATYSDADAKKAIVVAPTPNASTGKMAVTELNQVNFNIGGNTITKAEDLIPFVGKNVSVALKVKSGSTEVVNTTASYKIVNRQVNYDLVPADKVIPWTYEFADQQSTAHTAANYLDKVLEFAEVDFADQTMDPVEFTNMLSAGTPTTIVKQDGVVVPGAADDWFKVTALTSINHKIAKVELKGYGFGNKKNTTFSYTKKYTVASVATDYNVTYSVTFGPKPVDETIDLGSVDVPYSSAGANVKNFTGELPSDKLYAKVNGFDNKADFTAALYESTPVKTAKVKRGNTTVNASGYTYLNIDNTGEYVRVSTNADMEAITDTYTFETKYTAWWGPKYTFKAAASVSVPNYTLSYVNTWADAQGNVVVPGHVESSVYVINNAKLNTYVKVNNAANAGASDVLSVEYLVKTVADATKGIANVPVAPVASTVNVAANTIADAVLTWGSYTARELDVDAVLYIVNTLDPSKKIELDRKALHLTTKQILSMTAKEVMKPRPGNAQVTENFWQALTINSTLDKETVAGVTSPVNFVDYTTDGLKTTYKNMYGLNVEFKDVKVYINEIDKTAEYSLDNYDVNLSTGVVTLKSNEATLINPVTISATAVLTYDRDYKHKDAITVPVSVTFYQQ